MSSGSLSWKYLLVEEGKLARTTATLPALNEGWVRLRFLYCGLCGSDLSTFEGRRDIQYPRSLGHEFLAEVHAVSATVVGFEKGDLVTSDLNYRCGGCDHCRAGRSHLCRIGQSGLFSNRAFAEFGDLHATYLTKIEKPPGKHLALSEPLSCVMHALQWADPNPSERILVVGAGGLGTCLSFALSDPASAIPFEITDRLPRRAGQIANVTSLATNVPAPEGEYDVVLDLSGSEQGLRLACSHTRSGGRLCTMSHLDGYSSADFLLAALTRRDITFKVSYLNGELRNLDAAITALAENWNDDWDRLINVVSIEQLQGAFDTRRESEWCKTMIEVLP